MESALRCGAGAKGLRLIETMAWDGARLVRLNLHMDRLALGARLLEWAYDPDHVAAALRASYPLGAARMRLTMDRTGAVAVEVGTMPAPVAVWRVGVAVQRLTAGDPWLSLKSTRRAAYDAARAGLAAGLDEAVLLNERGEVCDGSITTLFFDRGAGMRTPPLACGVLPGVLRAEMGCAEEVLMEHELASVRLWVGNSLRGLMRGVFAG